MFQNDINLRFNGFNSEATTENGIAVPNLAEAEDPEDSGQKAVNYRTEPLWKRIGFPPDTPLEKTRDFDFTNVLSNSQVGGDPVTPVFIVRRVEEVRIRMLDPGGHPRNDDYLLHGHIWEQEPYVSGSQAHRQQSAFELGRFAGWSWTRHPFRLPPEKRSRRSLPRAGRLSLSHVHIVPL